MKDSFVRLTELCKKSIELDPWSRERGLHGYCRELRDEAEEVVEASEKEDYDNLKEELGDVLMDFVHAAILAEQSGRFTGKEIVDDVCEKLMRRKPFLEDGKKVSYEEARKLWKEAKIIEKQMKK